MSNLRLIVPYVIAILWRYDGLNGSDYERLVNTEKTRDSPLEI